MPSFATCVLEDAFSLFSSLWRFYYGKRAWWENDACKVNYGSMGKCFIAGIRNAFLFLFILGGLAVLLICISHY